MVAEGNKSIHIASLSAKVDGLTYVRVPADMRGTISTNSMSIAGLCSMPDRVPLFVEYEHLGRHCRLGLYHR